MSPVVTCTEDLRAIAKRRIPKMFYDYVDGGSWTQSTYFANEEDFSRIKLRQRVAVDLDGRSLKSSMLGESVAMPVGLAPTGNTGMVHADGEILAARAAEEFGVPFTLSTMSICSIEDVAQKVRKPFWFQLYMMRDRSFIESLIDRAKSASCSALMITLDLPVPGQRHKDRKNGLTTPPKPTIGNLLNIATKPLWCMGMAGTSRRTFGNIVVHAKGVDNISTLSTWASKQFDSAVTWNDLEWIKKRWGGKIILKGVLDPEDARHAVSTGADAIVVSNHGGRQLDGAASTIDSLPAVVDAAKGGTEVWIDGGIRTGQDVIKALALGASATFIGRPFLYGLGAMGQAGVRKCLELIANELDLTMALCGRKELSSLDTSILLPGTFPTVERWSSSRD